jgi:nucleotide-binding universal stress UspA family protein
MDPLDAEIVPRPFPPARTRELSLDLAAAAESTVPVLISAPSDRALPIAIAIATSRGATPDDVLVVDGATARTQLSTLMKSGASGRGGHRVVLLRDIEAFDHAQQAAVMELLAQARRPGAAYRVIATTSVALFERVVEGSFDSELFYMLNMIHIKP